MSRSIDVVVASISIANMYVEFSFNGRQDSVWNKEKKTSKYLHEINKCVSIGFVKRWKEVFSAKKFG